MKIVVVGAGAIGLSVAGALAGAGAEVTVLEQHGPGAGTTSLSYAWVNSNNKNPHSYHVLNKAGLDLYHRWAERLKGAFVPSGHLEVASDPAHVAELTERTARLGELGYAAEFVTRERARALEPDLALPPDADSIVLFSREGYCHGMPLVAALRGIAVAAGATIVPQARVIGLEPGSEGVRVRLEGRPPMLADTVVSCVGRWTGALTGTVAEPVPLVDTGQTGSAAVGFLGVTEPVPVTLDRLVTSSRLNMRPHGGGRLMLQALDLDESADPHDPPGPGSAVGTEMLARLRRLMPEIGAPRLETKVGQRVLPLDGLTVAGWLERTQRVYVIATHSGVTMALLLGEMAVSEILRDRPVAMLDDFRPGRFRNATVQEVAAPRRPGEQ